MGSPSWMRSRREPGLPGYGGVYAGVGRGESSGGTSTALDADLQRTVRATADLAEAKANEARVMTGVRAARVLVGQDQQPVAPAATAADPLASTKMVVDVMSGVAGMVNGTIERVQEDNRQLREAKGKDFEQGQQVAEEIAEIKLGALERAHEMHLESLSAIREISDKKDERFEATVGELRKEIGELRAGQLQAQIDALRAENEKLKAAGTTGQVAGGTASVPITGMRQVTLPDGRVIYVMDSPSNVKAAMGQLKEQLDDLAGVTESLDRIRGSGAQQRPAIDYNDPNVRWQHAAIDWEDRAREREEARKDKIAAAQVRREESTSKAIDALPGFVQRHAPKMFAAVTGGAPERGAHNGLPEQPPTRRAPVLQQERRQPPQPPQPPDSPNATLPDDGESRFEI